MSEGELTQTPRFVKTELRALQGEELKSTEEINTEKFDEIVTKVREIVGPMPTEIPISEYTGKPYGGENPWQELYLKGTSGKIYSIYKAAWGGANPKDNISFSSEDPKREERWSFIADNDKSFDPRSESMYYESTPKLRSDKDVKVNAKYTTKAPYNPSYKPNKFFASLTSTPQEEKEAFEKAEQLVEDLAHAEVISADNYLEATKQKIAEEAQPFSIEDYPEVENPEESFENALTQFLSLAGALHESPESSSGIVNFRSESGDKYYLSYDVGPEMRFYLTTKHPGVEETWFLVVKEGPSPEKYLTYERKPESAYMDAHLELKGGYDIGGKDDWEETSPSTPNEERIAFKKTDDVLKELTGKIEVIDYMDKVTKTAEVARPPKVIVGGPPPVPALAG